jgi:uncharacterized membrane protein YesL
MMKNFLHLESRTMRFLTRLVDLLLLNTLFLITCLPIITIGAAVMSLNTSHQKYLRNDERIFVNYLDCFKKQLVPGFVLELSCGACWLIYLLNMQILPLQPVGIQLMGYLVLGPALYMLLLLTIFLFSYCGRYEGTWTQSIKNCLLLIIQNKKYTIPLFLVNFLPLYFVMNSVVGFVTGLYFFTFGGCAFLSLINNYFLKGVYDRAEKSET